MRVVALDGPSLAGKTTAIRELTHECPWVTAVGCYATFVRSVPMASATTEGVLAAAAFYLDVERQRRESIDESMTVLLDRSVNSLLAHSYAMDVVHSLDSFTRVAGLVDAAIAAGEALVPDVVFAVAVTPEAQRQRQPGSHPRPSALLDPELNDAIMSFLAAGRVRARSRCWVPFGHPLVSTVRSAITVSSS